MAIQEKDITQDEILERFKQKYNTADIIVALVKDVRFTALFDKWLKELTWQEILMNENADTLDYSRFFAVESSTNRRQTYQDYLEGNAKEGARAICYAHDIASEADEIRLELAFPKLFSKDIIDNADVEK